MRATVRYVLLGIGVVLFIVGLAGHIWWSQLYQSIINSQMVLSPTSEAYSTWQDPPFPIFLRVYLFNCTNSDELLRTNFTVKPEMQELGPYTFRERRVKQNITWNDNGTVSYQEVRIWHHLPEESKGRLDDMVINLNVPAVTAAYLVRFQMGFMRDAIHKIMQYVNDNAFMTASVGDLLFDGYNSSFINAAKTMPFVDNIPFDKFGWFYEKNNSHDGMYTVFTGENNSGLTAIIDKWNGSSKLPYWTDECNNIKGTVGEVWPPGIKPKEPLTFFVSDVCRTLTLDYSGQTDYNSIGVNKYSPSANLFANSSVNPSNACYDKGGESAPNGLVNETVCKMGAPAFLSFPHFYMADPALADRIKGMHQNWDNHSTSILLEPMTGAPVSVQAKFQVNLLIQAIDLIPEFQGIPPTYFPMVWFSESVDLGSSDMMTMLKLVTVILPIVFFVFFTVALVLGVALMLPAFIHWGKNVCLAPKDDTVEGVRTALLSSSPTGSTQYVQ